MTQKLVKTTREKDCDTFVVLTLCYSIMQENIDRMTNRQICVNVIHRKRSLNEQNMKSEEKK